ncbi:hypothetical protein D5S17_06540 [Pseudonocardiaceae bacterium YIM PH 21723]|nr:hypothetical protein D5S17_06540 [Pseudonocardiaceae bacterium YIM PH 21723]
MTDTPTCAVCGRRRRPDLPPAEALTWIHDNERGRVRFTCPECARAHLRSIEAKLAAEYW